jgi:hypothetical protein
MSIVGNMVKSAASNAEHLAETELKLISTEEQNIKNILSKVQMSNVSATLASVLPIGLNAGDYSSIGASLVAIYSNLVSIGTKLKSANL